MIAPPIPPAAARPGNAEAAPPTPPNPSPASLRGLDPAAAARPALTVLSEVAWEGAVLDPSSTPAGDFLALL